MVEASRQPGAAPGANTPSTSVRTLVDSDGTVHHDVSRSDVERHLAGGTFFWLDLPCIGDEELTWLRDVFRFHPLAVEDTEHFGQRPKLDEYDGYVFLVLYGSSVAQPRSDGSLDYPAGSCSPSEIQSLSEVHFFVAGSYMVTVHRDNCPAFSALAARMRLRGHMAVNPDQLFYRVADTLVDSFFPVLSDLDDRIDELQGEVINRPTNAQLGELLDYKSSLIALRRVIAPQRDLFAGLASGSTPLNEEGSESNRYYHDVYDHLIRLADLVDSYRDLMSGTTDAYLSVVSNQLNKVMKQLTIIATVFLPLSFLTGFFGQNFAWMVSRLGSLGAFLGLGLGTEVAAVAILYVTARRRGWIGGP
jgi:magnesium transporter